MEIELKSSFMTHSLVICCKRTTDFYEFIYVTRGNIILEIAGKERTLSVGDGYFMIPGLEVCCSITDNSSACRNIYIEENFFAACCNFIDAEMLDELREKQHLPFKLTYDNTLVSEEKFVGFLREPNIVIRKRWEKFLTEMLISELLNPTQALKTNSKDFYNQCTIVLNMVCTFPDYMQRLQDEIGYHKVYLCRKFKEVFGKTISEYVMELRLQFIEYHLKTTDYPAAKICSMAGIESFSYFNRIFKKKHGMTPTEYRLKNKK